MGRTRGLRLGRKLVHVFGSFINRRARARAPFQRLGTSSCTSRAVSKLCSWGRSLRHGARGLCFGKRNSGYTRIGQEHVYRSKPLSVPKGHLPVYVGEKDDDTYRVVLPVIYFNHPLFANLLREAETVCEFNHPGGIQIPCQKSEFEDVKMRIAAASGGGICRGRQSWRQLLVTCGSDNLDH